MLLTKQLTGGVYVHPIILEMSGKLKLTHLKLALDLLPTHLMQPMLIRIKPLEIYWV